MKTFLTLLTLFFLTADSHPAPTNALGDCL